jgi:hypothetical protein
MLALRDAEEFFAKAATDPALMKALKARAAVSEPPPPPKTEDGQLYLALNSECTYRWAKLSPAYLRSQHLESEPGPDSPWKSLFDGLARARNEGRVFLMHSQIYWSQHRPPSSTRGEGIDYFVLIRVGPTEEAILAEEITITLERPSNDYPNSALSGRLDDSGTAKLATLTQRNRPSETIKRGLAIIVRGEIITSPVLKEAITTGHFVIDMGPDSSPQDAEEIFAALHGN